MSSKVFVDVNEEEKDRHLKKKGGAINLFFQVYYFN